MTRRVTGTTTSLHFDCRRCRERQLLRLMPQSRSTTGSSYYLARAEAAEALQGALTESCGRFMTPSVLSSASLLRNRNRRVPCSDLDTFALVMGRQAGKLHPPGQHIAMRFMLASR